MDISIVWCLLRRWVVPSLLSRIIPIFLLRASPQVLGVDTRRGIANVQDIHPVWDWSDKLLVRHTMRRRWLAARHGYLSVPARSLGAREYPAAILVTVDFFHEPLCYRSCRARFHVRQTAVFLRVAVRCTASGGGSGMRSESHCSKPGFRCCPCRASSSSHSSAGAARLKPGARGYSGRPRLVTAS